jgi:hypothetical protein
MILMHLNARICQISNMAWKIMETHLSWIALAGLPLVHLKGAMPQAKGHWSKAPEKVLH